METNYIKIAWVINAYQKPEQLTHIINTIMGERDSVWLHYDKKSPLSEIEYLRQYYRNDSRVNIFQKYSVFWAGHEGILVDWFLAKKLLRSQRSFDYVVHFTGTTYPIKKIDSFRLFLTQNYAKTFIQLDPNEKIHENGSERSRFFAKEHFGIYPGRNIPRYKLWGKIKYKINLKLLRFLSIIGIIKSKFFLPGAFPNIYRGFVHNIIFRDHYLAVLKDKRSCKLLKELRYIFCPDEVFFNTALTNIVPSDKIVRDNNLLITYWRKGNASPDNINENDLDNLLQSDRFFARKFESIDLLKSLDTALIAL